MNAEQWTKIDSIFHEALERPQAERAAFLKTACGGDTDLLREIASLLIEAEKDDTGTVFHEEFSAAASDVLRQDQERFAAGQKIGHFEIIALLGAGGMGEVYKAIDGQLKRTVAIKVLPLSFAADPQRMARFQQEAELLASLSHPNIAVVHGIQYSDGLPAIVLELVAGETLAERVSRGSIPIQEALTIARQVAEALEAAHSQGVIHCDLKPANIKLTPEGRVKVLDFGIATILQSDSSLKTTDPLKASLMIAGTPSYMSLEQASNRGIDRASDIWGFGCVLYELLTGHQAFIAKTVAEVQTAILNTEPDWNALPEVTPDSVRTLLRRCLQRDRKGRLHDIADARIELEDALNAPKHVVKPTQGTGGTNSGRWLVVAVTAIGFSLLAIVITVVQYRSPKLSASPFRVAVDNPGLNTNISPDGRYLVYESEGYNGGIWLQPLDSEAPLRLLPGTDGYDGPPRWSPDSRHIIFFQKQRLTKIAIDGGAAQVICDVPDSIPPGGHVASWGANDIIVFELQNALYKVAASGGVPTPVRIPDASRGEKRFRFPYFLPNGDDFVFLADAIKPEASDIRAASLNSSAMKRIIGNRSSAVITASGFMLFIRNGALVAQQFDPRTWVLFGDAIELDKSVQYSANGWASMSASRTGTLVYVMPPVPPPTRLQWFSRDGKELDEVHQPVGSMMAMSPDGIHLAHTSDSPVTNPGIWIYDLLRGTDTRLTGESSVRGLRFSADGKAILFQSLRSGQWDFYKKSFEPGEALVALGLEGLNSVSFSPDERFILFSKDDAETKRDVWSMSMHDRKAEPLLNSIENEDTPVFSPDGKLFAYTINGQIFVRRFPLTAESWQISLNGGRALHWRDDGKELFFIAAPDGKTSTAPMIMAASTSLGDSFKAGIPQRLFSIIRLSPDYAVTRDGQRFLVQMPDNVPLAKTTIVVNWDAHLKK